MIMYMDYVLLLRELEVYVCIPDLCACMLVSLWYHRVDRQGRGTTMIVHLLHRNFTVSGTTAIATSSRSSRWNVSQHGWRSNEEGHVCG